MWYKPKGTKISYNLLKVLKKKKRIDSSYESSLSLLNKVYHTEQRLCICSAHSEISNAQSGHFP